MKFNIKVTDENGNIFDTKELENIRIQPLSDKDGNYSINNITDAKGENLNLSELKDSSGDDLPKAILIDIEATHSGKNLNYAIYPEDSLVNDHKTYLKDFAKPLLKNHDTNSEPLGRVVETDFSDSVISLDKKAVKLKIKVTDSDAIKKFIDGRYKTFSIGASADTITCDLCKTKILKNGVFDFCGHWRGGTYDVVVDGTEETEKKTAYWVFEDMYFSEISVVNNPADRNAQLTGISVEDELEDNNNVKISNSKKELLDLINNSENDDELFNSIMDSISSVEDDNEDEEEDEEDESTETDDPTEDDKSTETDDPEVENEDESTETDDESTETDDDSELEDEEKIESLKDKIKTLENTNEELLEKIDDLEKENKELKKSLESKKEELEEKQSDNLILEKENEVVIDKLSIFARKLKNQLQNRIMDLKIVTSKEEITDKSKDKFNNEIKNMSIEEMSVEINQLKRKIKPKKLIDNTIGLNNGGNVETIVESKDKETLGEYLESLN